MCCQGSVRRLLSAQGPRRRVWWAPTDDKARSDFGGMFWTATVMKKTASGYKVIYDNGARVRSLRPACCALTSTDRQTRLRATQARSPRSTARMCSCCRRWPLGRRSMRCRCEYQPLT